MRQECLGVDLGNVIIDHVGFGTTPEFFQTGDYNTIPPVDGVFEALHCLNQERFNGNIFVVYNASDVADQKITSWLLAYDFFNRTGVLPDRVMRTQNGRNKWTLCELYGATHFVDDRLEVLGHLVGKIDNLFLFRSQQKEVDRYRSFLDYVRQVNTWNEFVRILLT